MKLAILCNNRNSFPLPMARGLERMLKGIGEECRVFVHGWKLIRPYRRPPARKLAKRGLLALARRYQATMLRQLRDYDAIIVVGHMPNAFRPHFIDRDLLRGCAGEKPVILYDLVSLLDKQSWATELREKNHRTLELYDHYLLAAPVQTRKHANHPACTTIGINLDDGTLYPEQTDFRVLLDFPREGYGEQRALQIAALNEARVPYLELNGEYPRDSLMKLFRKSAALFLSFPESFGLPACEIQACGGVVFSPGPGWIGMHRTNPGQEGNPQFTGNFFFYGDNRDLLVKQLQELKRDFDPQRNRQTFCQQQELYFKGSPEALGTFVEQLKSGEIFDGRGSRFTDPEWAFQEAP